MIILWLITDLSNILMESLMYNNHMFTRAVNWLNCMDSLIAIDSKLIVQVFKNLQ